MTAVHGDLYFPCVHGDIGPDNMYVYEGEDYSKCSDEDKKSFDQLLAGIAILYIR